jgi:hypothetical protein
VCHEQVGNRAVWSEEKQLAVIKYRRPRDFDLVAYNTLVNPRAMERILMEEVNKHLPTWYTT